MILGDDWILYQNPKTGSTSMHNTLGKAGFPREAGHSILPHPSRGKRIWTTVRNPFDRLVSGYYYWQEWEGLTFLQWITGEPKKVTAGVDFLRTPQYYWYSQSLGREPHLIRYEDINEDFERFKLRENIQCGSLEYHNKTASRKARNYRDVIDPKSRDIIFDRFATDFRELKYDW